MLFWKLWSDGQGEFDKGRGEPMPGVDIQPELVVAAPKVLHECVSGADHSGRAEPFEPTHWSQPGLELTMIGFDRIVRILLHKVTRRRHQLIEDRG
jgi:hypothetical protein